MDDSQIQKIIQDLHTRISKLETQRINQQQILPGAIFARHINNAFLLYKGLDKNKPANGSTEVQFWLSTDTNKFWAWNGSSWVGTVLS